MCKRLVKSKGYRAGKVLELLSWQYEGAVTLENEVVDDYRECPEPKPTPARPKQYFEGYVHIRILTPSCYSRDTGCQVLLHYYIQTIEDIPKEGIGAVQP